MIRSNLLAGAAALALLVAAPGASFAQSRGGGAAHIGGGGGHMGGGGGHMGGGGAMHMGGGHMGGGGMRGGGAHFAGGAAHMGGGPRFTGGGVNTAARVAAAPGAGRTFAGNRTGWNGGHWRGGRYHHRHFFPGLAAGAVIGGLGSYGYYGGPDYYYGPDYDDSYYDTGPEVAVVPGGGDAVAYCEQRFKSYDPASGTYLGYDGKRHPCP